LRIRNPDSIEGEVERPVSAHVRESTCVQEESTVCLDDLCDIGEAGGVAHRGRVSNEWEETPTACQVVMTTLEMRGCYTLHIGIGELYSGKKQAVFLTHLRLQCVDR
jgi:hypothetical protein